MVRKVEVIPYQVEWLERFQIEKSLLLKLFPQHEIVIHHIGSTSVPGLAAKPIIDLLIESDSLSIFDQKAQELEGKLGYEARGENGIPGRRYFVRFSPQGERLVHLHGFQKGHSDIERHLIFRDYLRLHPVQADLYGKIKLEAAEKFPLDVESYISYKNFIVKELEQKALEWKKGQTK
ncbi:GrpB family protein [Neobacillus sp. D3-1R]|uniref:GrpB family protein n=1 Tax=Neobacillus sp. D3-1R TaxID=3445778 RepID=UPI003F9EE4F5